MTAPDGDLLDEPIDIGDRFRWADSGGIVEVLTMSITEDGVVQVRVDDDEKRTVTASDIVDKVGSGELQRADSSVVDSHQ